MSYSFNVIERLSTTVIVVAGLVVRKKSCALLSSRGLGRSRLTRSPEECHGPQWQCSDWCGLFRGAGVWKKRIQIFQHQMFMSWHQVLMEQVRKYHIYNTKKMLHSEMLWYRCEEDFKLTEIYTAVTHINRVNKTYKHIF